MPSLAPKRPHSRLRGSSGSPNKQKIGRKSGESYAGRRSIYPRSLVLLQFYASGNTIIRERVFLFVALVGIMRE